MRLLILLVLMGGAASNDASAAPINAVIGDQGLGGRSFVDDRDAIRAHLGFVHARLTATPGEPATHAARARNLQRLANYRQAGAFPVNDYVAERVPVFVDRAGRRCAVAALIEADLGATFVEQIARDHRLDLLPEISDPRVLAWIETSGLTLTELSVIQPSYAFEKPREPPVEQVLVLAMEYVYQECLDEAYPKRHVLMYEIGHELKAKVTVGARGIHDLQLVEPAKPPRGDRTRTWTLRELTKCFKVRLTSYLPRGVALPAGVHSINVPGAGGPQADQDQWALGAAYSILSRLLKPVAITCGAKSSGFASLVIAADGKPLAINSTFRDEIEACIAAAAMKHSYAPSAQEYEVMVSLDVVNPIYDHAKIRRGEIAKMLSGSGS